MTDEQMTEARLLRVRANIEEVLTKRAAMMAANETRHQVNESLAYDEQAFYPLQRRLEVLASECGDIQHGL